MANQKSHRPQVAAQPKSALSQTKPAVPQKKPAAHQPKVTGIASERFHVRAKNPVTPEAVKRVQRAVSAKHDGKTPADSLPSRLQSVFDRSQSSGA